MDDELAGLMAEATSIAEDARRTFGRLSAEQLDWKPSPEEWSVAQCFDHLVRIDSSYFPTLERIERGQHEPSLLERVPLLPRLYARMVLHAVQPKGQRKLRADPRFAPSGSAVGGDIIARFRAHQEEVVAHIERAQRLDPRKVILTSPVLSFVTYSLLDAYRIIVTHERRHIAQARRVMEREGFPGLGTGAPTSSP